MARPRVRSPSCRNVVHALPDSLGHYMEDGEDEVEGEVATDEEGEVVGKEDVQEVEDGEDEEEGEVAKEEEGEVVGEEMEAEG